MSKEIIPGTPHFVGNQCRKCGERKRYIKGNMCVTCWIARSKVNYRKIGRDEYRNKSLIKLYGISLAERDAMLSAQGNCCAICKATSPGKKDWHVDHDHKTRVVRGVLCGGCNPGIGHFDDSPPVLLAAIHYLGDRGAPFIGTPISDWLKANPLQP